MCNKFDISLHKYWNCCNNFQTLKVKHNLSMNLQFDKLNMISLLLVNTENYRLHPTLHLYQLNHHQMLEEYTKYRYNTPHTCKYHLNNMNYNQILLQFDQDTIEMYIEDMLYKLDIS